MAEYSRQIGISGATAKLLAGHHKGKHLEVVQHDAWHGGHYVLMTEEQYAQLEQHIDTEVWTTDHARGSRSAIEAALIKAYS